MFSPLLNLFVILNIFFYIEMDQNINDFDDESNDKLELYVVLQAVMQELHALCAVAFVVIEVV
ncbi:hypothetical protein HYC85_006004 [Camellia sinensis]|uniref:Uncharacterized protein n=1 Tax=Camellia sinensis TaxID=4442 RepID=A0A7J7I1I0_CAMSI|nr:hypothetical protein HYC85_006004 [Camellia sinensis]